jgi:two-component system sensor histidine kinase KdpD
VKAEVPRGLPLVQADAVLLAQVLENLIDNALQYSDSAVQVNVQGAPGAVHVDVLDRGPGIAEEDRPRIFDMFFRGAGHGSVRGAGLGLTVGRSIAEVHGGALTLCARDGGGSCFRLTLPVHEAPPIAPEGAAP